MSHRRTRGNRASERRAAVADATTDTTHPTADPTPDTFPRITFRRHHGIYQPGATTDQVPPGPADVLVRRGIAEWTPPEPATATAAADGSESSPATPDEQSGPVDDPKSADDPKPAVTVRTRRR